jgi:hypothetical protein
MFLDIRSATVCPMVDPDQVRYTIPSGPARKRSGNISHEQKNIVVK